VLVWLEEGLRSTERELGGEAERGTRELLRYPEKAHMFKELVDISTGAWKVFLAREKVLQTTVAHGKAALLWESGNEKLMIPNERRTHALDLTRARPG